MRKEITRHILTPGLCLVIISGMCSYGIADIVHLKDGKKLEGKVIEETDEFVKLEVSIGTIKIGSEHIVTVQKDMLKKGWVLSVDETSKQLELHSNEIGKLTWLKSHGDSNYLGAISLYIEAARRKKKLKDLPRKPSRFGYDTLASEREALQAKIEELREEAAVQKEIADLKVFPAETSRWLKRCSRDKEKLMFVKTHGSPAYRDAFKHYEDAIKAEEELVKLREKREQEIAILRQKIGTLKEEKRRTEGKLGRAYKYRKAKDADLNKISKLKDEIAKYQDELLLKTREGKPHRKDTLGKKIEEYKNKIQESREKGDQEKEKADLKLAEQGILVE